MSFLAPLFLAGALAIALPVVFHLIRRTTRQRTVFSSLMFLKPTPPRLTKRNRLEHLFLLLLRCGAICLLAMGFARPFVKQVVPETPSPEAPRRIIVLVDTSASMRRANLWSQARERAAAVLNKTTPGDHVALFTFDRQLKPLVMFDEWNAAAAPDRVSLARNRLAQVKPGWSATRLDQAVVRGAELLAEADKTDLPGPRQIVLISDFQEGSKLSALQGQEWPKGVEVVSERLEAKTSNAGVQILASVNESLAAAVRVRVSNEPDSRREQFQVGWAGNNGDLLAGQDVYVPAGQTRIVALPAPEKNSGADRIILRGDDEPFDNTVFSIPPEVSRVKVIYIGSDSETDSRAPLFFVRLALQSSPRQTIEVIAKKADAMLAAAEIDDAKLFIVTDTLSEQSIAALRNQLAQGKTILFAPTSADASATLGALLGQSRIAAEEAAVRNYAMLGEIDFRHPLFAPFADARYSDFTKIHFWKYRKLDLSGISDARVAASFDSGDPAIVDISAGKGRVFLFTSGWQPADSQVALSTKFVPLLASVLELSGGAAETVAQHFVGDSVPLPAGWRTNGAAAMQLPDGSTLNVAADATTFTQTTMPGIYHLKSGPSEKRFAVNLDAAESRTAPLPLDELERLGAPVEKVAVQTAGATAQKKTVLQSVELESRQKLWRWFIVAALGVLLMETGIAGWTARRRISQEGATA